MAKKFNISVRTFAGKIGSGIDELYSLGINSVVGIIPGVMNIDEALKSGKENLERASENIIRIIEVQNIRKNQH